MADKDDKYLLNDEEVESHPMDDLKANFRSWEMDPEPGDAEKLYNILLDRHPEEDKKYLKKLAYNWVDEPLDEAEKETITTYGPDDEAEDKAKAIKSADEEDVSFNDDGTISVKEDESIEEVETTRVMKFDLKKGSDVKELQQMLDKGVDSKKITVGTDGEIQISENTNKKTLKIKDVKKLIEERKKINLSEKEIMSILFEKENPLMSKSELVEEINKKIIYEADMNDNVRRSFESGDNDYSEHLNPEIVNSAANEAFREIAEKLRQKTGRDRVGMMDVNMLLSNSLTQAAKSEYSYGTDRLEQKAIEMIRRQFNIPEDAVNFDVEITGIPSVMVTGSERISDQQAQQLSAQLGFKVGNINKEGLKYEKDTNTRLPQGKSEEEMKKKVTRRRLSNAMMQGAARKSQNLHHMDDELRRNQPNLTNDYGNIMAANDAMYYMMDDDSIKEQGRSGVHAGNSRVILSDQPGGKPTIVAQGMVFPILLHEMAKGVIELMSLWSLPKDPEVRKYVLSQTDHLGAETNDIRLGPTMWSKFIDSIPGDNQEVISLTWHKMQELPDEEFNSIIEGLLESRDEAKNKVREIAEEAIEELRREEYEDAIGSGDDNYGDEDHDSEDLLGGDQEEPSDEPEEEMGEPDYSTWSKSQIQNEIDNALDRGDFELVAKLAQYLR